MNVRELTAFMSKVQINASGCWVWMGIVSMEGQPIINKGKKKIRARREAYEHFVGAIPQDHVLSSVCGNRSCVNPSHVDVVDKTDFIKAQSKKRFLNPGRTCRKGHPMTPENVMMSNGRTRCKICYSAWFEKKRKQKTSGTKR